MMNQSQEAKHSIRLRGRGAALQVTFEDSAVPSIPEVLREFRDAGSLVTDFPLQFDFGDLEVRREWMARLIFDVIYPLNIRVRGWTTSNPETQAALASLGLAASECDRPVISDGTLRILWTPLRSGQSFHHDGDIILVGNLHDGAELTATGSICVLGQMKGLVHAGSGGDNSAAVIALSYMANQLRIGSLVSNTLDPAQCSWWGKAVAVGASGESLVVRYIQK